MIIIDSQQELANYLESIHFEGQGIVKLDGPTFELSNSVVDELTIVHWDVYKEASAKTLAKFEELTMLVLFQPIEEVVKHYTDNLIDIITPITPRELFINKVDTLSELIKERQVLKSQLISMNKELSETLGTVEVELLRIKKFYEQKIPKRFNNIKGIEVYSKYAAGESMGGEFFDLHIAQNKALVVMGSTSSYLVSSAMIQLFSEVKKENVITDELEIGFIEDLQHDVSELNKTKKKKIAMHLFTAIIDLSKHSIKGHVLGEFRAISSQAKNNFSSKVVDFETMNIDELQFERQFDRGERLLLCSSGFVFNWKKLKPEFMIEELVMNKKIKPLDILDEVFFQLKKDSASGFLPADASAIMLEVRQNAMVEI